MEYRASVAVESDSILTQIVYSMAKRYKNSFLQWNIVFGWLLSPSQYPHKLYIQLQNAKKWCFPMEYHVCVAVESDSIPTQIVYSIAKR